MDCGCGPFTAYCDMEGNWTVFQRRFNGALPFYRNWTEYLNGFGVARGEYWMALKNIYCMSSTYPGTKLRVELGDWEGNSYYAEYSQFVVGDGSTNYRMISSPTTVDRCLVPMTKIMTIGVVLIVQSHTEEVGGTTAANSLILTVSTWEKE